MSVEILASKLPDVMGTYKRLSHTVLSCIVSCVRTSEQDVWCWVVTVTYRYWLPVIEWPVKLYVIRTFLNVFFKIQKNDFYVFWVVAHVFSNTGWHAFNVLATFLPKWSLAVSTISDCCKNSASSAPKHAIFGLKVRKFSGKGAQLLHHP